jgi:uncharacterized protein (DUF927 family)
MLSPSPSSFPSQLSITAPAKIESVISAPQFPEQIAAQRFTKKQLAKGFKKQALHVYQNASGQALYWRIRLKNPNTSEKWIRPLSCDANGNFSLKEPRFENGKPLYCLPALLQNTDKTVWVVEGEACVDRLKKLGLIATTSGGVDSVQTTNWSPLSKRRIIVWPDNDEAGTQYAHSVTQKLQSLGCEIHWVDVAQLGLPAKGDCVDWLVQHPDSTLSDVEALPIKEKEPAKTTLLTSDKTGDSSLLEDKKHPTKHTTEHAHFFRVNETGVFYLIDDEPRWICSQLRVKALIRDKSSENWGRLLEFYDADGQLHTWAMPMEMLKGSGEELRGELLRLGLEIAMSAKTRHLLTEYIISSRPQSRARCVTRTGWHPPVFVLPDCTIGRCHKNEVVLFQSENRARDYKQSDTLENWQQEISMRCIGNSRLIFAVSCAFAAMLLTPANKESGGINLVSESSTGKTTALRVAASVYGAPDYLHRWRATANGLEALATLRSDTLLILDELAQVDSKEVGGIAYMLANGSGKARAGKNGQARSRTEWRLLFLSAGEISLEQHLQEAGKRVKAGHEVRLVDMPADAGKGMGIFENLHGYESAAIFSQALANATSQYYGVAARSFLETITTATHFISLSEVIKKLSKQFITHNLPKNASGQVHRVCERFALIAAAGELASSYGITQWPADEANQAISQCFCDWLVQRGGIENQEKSLILSQVRRFFEAHGESRFTDLNGQNVRTINRVGFKKIDLANEATTYYVMPETLKNEICAGLDYRSVTRTLLAEGWLAPDMNNAPYRRERLPGMGQVRCYVFTNKMWES